VQDVYFDAEAREVIQPGALDANKVSASSIGDVLTLLFDGASVSLQTADDPLTASWMGTVRVPINPAAKAPGSYLQHLRGAVNKTEDARVTLIATLAGKTFISEFSFGKKHGGDVFHSFVSPLKGPAKSYVASIVILVERRDPTSTVLVNIDGLDVEAKSKEKA
jgi:hypothetical protein